MAVLLLAEDDEDIAMVLIRIFKRAGMTVFRAADGEAALRLAIAHRPDIVLTDLGMPKLDGWGLIRALRQHPELSGTPIAILSGQLRHGDGQAAAAGACTVLLKPCPREQLVGEIERLLAGGPHPHTGSPTECAARHPASL